MRLIPTLLFVILLSIAGFASAAEDDKKTYRIASYYIPLLVETCESGAFIEILHEAARRAHIRCEVILAPTKRSMRYFEDGDTIGIIPAMTTSLGKKAELTRPFCMKQIHAIVRQGDRIPQSIQELDGLHIGLTCGFAFPPSITMNENIEIEYADTTDKNLKKLFAGRIDVVVADAYSTLTIVKKMIQSGFAYKVSSVLYEEPTYIACQPTAEGKELARKLSVALDTMEADGTIKRILPDITETNP